MINKKYTILIKTLYGLEDVLSAELKELGVDKINKLNRAVEIEGNLETLYKCNLHLRTALAVYLKISSGKTINQNQLYDFIRDIRWDELFSHEKTILIESFTNSKTLNHSQFVSQKIKDGIADHFKDLTGKRPSVSKDRPDIKIYAHINYDKCSIYLNSSGTPLYYRGYNKRTGKAPINDILAAGIIKLANWNPSTMLYDPMCGCGTIIAEAYMIANNIPPAIKRNYFAFKSWHNYDEAIWNNIVAKAQKDITNSYCEIYCNDIDNKIVNDLKINLSRIDPKHNIHISNKDFFKSDPPDKEGTIITNPPYGMRFSNIDIDDFYKKLGDKLKFEFNNYTAWIISSELKAIKLIGLKPEKKYILYNGSLESRFNKYTIYKGSKKN